MNRILLLIGGLINLLVGAMHVSLGQGLNVSQSLSCLSLDIQATLYTLNVHVAFTCLIFAYLSFFHRKGLLLTSTGRAVTAAIALFWILRAVNQVLFYGVSASATPFWVIFCLMVSLLYVVPILWKRPAILAPVG